MPKDLLVYRGWIGGRESDRVELEALGVDVGNWNPDAMAFDYCSMTVDVYWRFRERWKGRFVWGLIGKRETVYSQEEQDIDIPF